MKGKILVIGLIIGILVSILAAATISTNAAASGFYISNGKLYDANGKLFVMRGINHAHAWWKGNEGVAIPAIAKTGANTVRIALGNGDKWGYDGIDTVRKLISLCEQNKMIAVLEVHDATGLDDVARLNSAVNYWISMKDALIGKESTVIINIANEWYGTWNGADWAAGYKAAIPKLRDAGLNHTLMVDAAGWGQYPKSIHDYGVEVFNTDTKKNTMFSIHMYEYAGGNGTQVVSNIDGVLNKGLALCIGEFGFKHTDGDVDEATIMSYSRNKGVGWIGWSWYGNGQDWIYLDMTYNWAGTSLTDWGKRIIDGPNGIKETSKICSVFGSNPTANPTSNPTTAPVNITVQAESGTKNGTGVGTSRSGYWGSGYVNGLDTTGDYVQVTVNVPVAGNYNVNLRYAAPYGEKGNTLYINGNNHGQKRFSSSASFTNYAVGSIALNAGNNTIRLQKDPNDWGWIELDAVQVQR